MSGILVYIEQMDNEITDVSLQCLAKGMELKNNFNEDLDALIIGSNLDNVLAKLKEYGIRNIYYADNPNLKSYLATPYQKAFTETMNKTAAKTILCPASTSGNDLASAVSVSLGKSCILECKEIAIEGKKIIAKRAEFDNKVLTNFCASADDAVFISCKDGISDPIEHQGAQTAQVSALDIVIDEADLISKVIKHELAKKTVNLKAAKVIVTAGAGIGSKDNIKLVEDLAKAVNGEMGATRPVVDANWTTADRQIGQTGTTVKPDLYIACGVSGAVQHRVGMMDSKKIIAINTDPSAPIFKIANYGIVGDLNSVIPKLIKLLSK